VNKIKQQRS